MYNNNKRRVISEINIVPYVDVMLVLLVIFMVTTPLIMQGVQVDLPNAKADPLPQDSELPVIVTVDQNGILYLNIAESPTQPMEEEYVAAEVAAALIRDPKRIVLVRGDKLASYSTVLETMVLLQHSGVRSVGLETESEADV
jgi:biopolymer transport protein TolR